MATTHPVLSSSSPSGAIITGGGYGGIGFSIAVTLLTKRNFKVIIADINESSITKSISALGDEYGVPSEKVKGVVTDVTKLESYENLKKEADAFFGELPLTFLALNAGVGFRSTAWSAIEEFRKTMDVNFYGVLNGLQVFTEDIIKHGKPAAIIITGSKQGITMPPGNTGYNVSKAAVKSLAEQLSHSLTATAPQVTAHLLVPGWTFTKLASDPSKHKDGYPDISQKPAGAWTSDQVADELFDKMNLGQFYIICPDNDVDRQTDLGRMAWTAGDLLEGRPPLSRWHSDFKHKFEEHMSKFKA
ncbi:putative short-chain dehydrogenase [Atractiella rhizophila]|nr:putative short-chain dehydrogenase [Atractiella rhizophila]